MTDKRLRAASQLSSKQKTPPSNRRATREREAVEVPFGKVVRCPSCLIGIAVPQPQNGVQVQAPSDTAETHQFGAETAELPMQEEERVTIAFAESIAQHIEQILELENLEDVYNSKITLHPNQITLDFKKRALGLLRLIRIYISLSGRNTELDVIITLELEKVC
ncbi:hypothetical protein HID58_042203 [Brassica napus]|uniref:Uncharacterized protein n=1 Tax=Brassica napus TaxID=3708 RepID=A0ABQ8BD21_BRANA|nr:hypothetical protein HID58_042203 [Brassica napus]